MTSCVITCWNTDPELDFSTIHELMHTIHERIKTHFEIKGQPMRRVSVNFTDSHGIISTHIKADSTFNVDIIAEILTIALQPSCTTISYDSDTFPRIETVFYDENTDRKINV